MHTNFFLISMVALAAITDLRSRRIPNALVASGMAAALMFQIFIPGGGGWTAWLFGALTGFALFFPIYMVRGMAAGDVKLMAAVGAFVGPLTALHIALATFLIGGAWGLAVIIFNRKVRATWTNLRAIAETLLMRARGLDASFSDKPYESVGRLPYGVAIALGTAMAMFW